MPLVVITTDLESGRPYLWEEGDLVDALLASCAIPGIFPPVRGPAGRLLVDGGLVDNLPTDVAIARGARTVLGILCRCCTRWQRSTRGLTRLLGQSFSIALECITRRGLYAGRKDAELFILQPDLGLDVEALDFAHSAELISEAYSFSLPRLRDWLGRREFRATTEAAVLDRCAPTGRSAPSIVGANPAGPFSFAGRQSPDSRPSATRPRSCPPYRGSGEGCSGRERCPSDRT